MLPQAPGTNEGTTKGRKEHPAWCAGTAVSASADGQLSGLWQFLTLAPSWHMVFRSSRSPWTILEAPDLSVVGSHLEVHQVPPSNQWLLHPLGPSSLFGIGFSCA